jgi:hypothetical protein
VRNGRALVTPYISNARLKQAFGNGQNALASKYLAFAHAKGLDFFMK